jgi:hypothetical protein
MVAQTPLLTITSHECYIWGGAEYNLLARLQLDDARSKCSRECLSLKKEAICEDESRDAIALCNHCDTKCEDMKNDDEWKPEKSPPGVLPGGTEADHAYTVRQGACESLFAHAIIYQTGGWIDDDDLLDELFDLNLRLFAAIAGVLADTSLGGAGGDILEDMTDIFDMYLWSFQDVSQHHEGLMPFDPYASTWNRGVEYVSSPPESFLKLCFHLITLAYLSVIYRACSCLRLIPLTDTCVARVVQMTPCMESRSEESKQGGSGTEWDTDEIQKALTKWHAFLSLLLIEVPFLVLRIAAFYNNKVPIGILALKNVHNIYYDLSTIFPSCSINEQGEDNGPDEMNQTPGQANLVGATSSASYRA